MKELFYDFGFVVYYCFVVSWGGGGGMGLCFIYNFEELEFLKLLYVGYGFVCFFFF